LNEVSPTAFAIASGRASEGSYGLILTRLDEELGDTLGGHERGAGDSFSFVAMQKNTLEHPDVVN